METASQTTCFRRTVRAPCNVSKPFLERSRLITLLAIAAISILGVTTAVAQEEKLTEEDEWGDVASSPSGVQAKAGSYLCSVTGCSGTFSAMVDSLRTLNDGSEMILLRSGVPDALRAAGACTTWTGAGLIVEGAGKDTIVGKLLVGLALDTRFHLRVAASGADCKIFYVRVFT